MPKVHNKYHGTAPQGAVYIGRPSKWGNPYDVKTHGRERAFDLFTDWVYADEQSELRNQARRELKGKDLVCFCKPKDCHGDLWLEIANSTPMIATNPKVEINHEYKEDQGSRTSHLDRGR